MSPFQQTFRQIVARSPLAWSEEDIRQGVRVGERLTILMAQQAAGQDVAEDLATVSASAKNIGSRASVGTAQAMHEAIVGAIAEVATRALLAAI